jgi:hypothetical protein
LGIKSLWLEEIGRYLRKPPPGYARSAYAVEANAWTTRGATEAALLFRGTLVSAFGYIENTLSHLCIQCSRLDHYAALRKTFPYKFDDKVDFLKKCCLHRPLNDCQSIACRFFDEMDDLKEIRNTSAHAHMRVLSGNHNIPPSIRFVNYTKRCGIPVAEMKTMSLPELEMLARKAARLSRRVQALNHKLDELGILPAVEKHW